MSAAPDRADFTAAEVDAAIEWLLCESHAMTIGQAGRDPMVTPRPVFEYAPHVPPPHAEYLALAAKLAAWHYARPGYLPDPWGEAAGLLLDGWRPGMAVGR